MKGAKNAHGIRIATICMYNIHNAYLSEIWIVLWVLGNSGISIDSKTYLLFNLKYNTNPQQNYNKKV